MYRNTRIAVVVPAHNEERLVAQTLGSMPDFVDAVFAVDDASEDATAREIARAAAGDRRIVPLSHSSNRGVGAAIVTGYREALKSPAEIVAVMDGDGQMDPCDLSALLDPIVDGRADFAKGYRFRGLLARGNMPLARLVGNHVLSAATRLAAGYAAPLDAQCGYTAIAARSLARLPLDELYPRYGFPNDLTIRCLEAGFRVRSIPVRAKYGAEVSGIRPLVAVPRIFALLARAALRRARPTAAGAPAPRSAEAAERT